MSTQKASLPSGETGLVLVNKMHKDVETHLAKIATFTRQRSRSVSFSQAGVTAGENRAKDISLTSRGLV